MKDAQKKEIQRLLDIYVTRFPSQAKAFQSIKDVSEGYLIAMRQGKWESISDDKWRIAAKQVGYTSKPSWKLVPTKDYLTMMALLGDAKENNLTYAIIGDPGKGKSKSAETFKKENDNVYHITCDEFMNRKEFLTEILDALGKDTTGSLAEMMRSIVSEIRKQDTPQLIFDELDKVPDNVLCFFVTLYNKLSSQCSLVMLGTEVLSKRILRGVRLKKKGYPEIYSRIGRSFIYLKGTSFDELKEICEANGVTDPKTITAIFNEYEGDLRRVDRAVHKVRKMAA